jgi:hypothetical protein
MGTKREVTRAMPRKQKNSLVGNINKRKRAGKSRSKKRSTVSKEAYRDMKKGWPKTGRRKKTR